MMNREQCLFSHWITNNPLLRGGITSSHKHSLILAVSPLLLFCTPPSSERIFLSNSHKLPRVKPFNHKATPLRLSSQTVICVTEDKERVVTLRTVDMRV